MRKIKNYIFHIYIHFNPIYYIPKIDRTKRMFFPNLQKKKVYSEILGKHFRITLSTYVIRCIDKKGGFDNYLLLTKNRDIDSDWGFDIKKQIIEAYELKENKKFNKKEYAERNMPIKIRAHENPMEVQVN